MEKKRALYYINQFYAGIGGEEKADIGLQEYDEKIGPALGMEKLWQGELEVVKTLACGDNYVNNDENFENLKPRIKEVIEEVKPDVVIAGPAFNAGRYGVACAKFIDFVRSECGVPGVTGMYKENPGVSMYGSENYIIETPETAAGMRKAIPPMASLALKIARGDEIGPARKVGYFPRGYRYNEWHEKIAGERAVDLLLKKLSGEEYNTEVPLRGFEQVDPAPAIKDLGDKKIAFITTGGLVPKGNPDGLKQAFSTSYGSYEIKDDPSVEEFESIHGGFDTTLVNENPARLVPYGSMEKLEKEGHVASIHPEFYSTAGVGTNIKNSQDLGEEIAREMKDAGVQAVILTST